MAHDTAAADFAQDLDAYEPSEADLEWYRDWCRERDERLFAERLAADEDAAYLAMRRGEADARLAAAVFASVKGSDFRQMLADLSNAFADHDSQDVRWVGLKLGDLFDLARSLEATSGDQFDDRLAACEDARG